MKYLKKFNQESEYQNFKISDEFILPNVSLIINDNKVLFNPLSSNSDMDYPTPNECDTVKYIISNNNEVFFY
jgi:hypothetical protein